MNLHQPQSLNDHLLAIIGLLGNALVQQQPSDDPIIMRNVKTAHDLAQQARKINAEAM